MRKLSLAVLAFAGALAAASWQPARADTTVDYLSEEPGLTLRERIMVDDDVVRLGDLFEEQISDADVAIAQAPKPGQTMALEARFLQQVARAYRLDWKPASKYQKVTIGRMSQRVTAEMVRNFVCGGAAISVLARQLDAALEVINLGTVTPLEALPGVIDLPLGRGTANFTLTPAMTHDQCQAALLAGRDAVLRACAGGADLFIGGEMGIGNTTAASAIASVLLDTSPLALAGPGTGLDADGVARKVAVIQRALLRHGDALEDPYELLRRLGGFELAALTGAYMACAQQGLPTLVDGFICSVAALCAQHLQPDTRDWLLFAHCGAEPGHAAVLLALGGEPLLDLGLRLGEGSGAALAVPLLQLSCRLHSEMATFAEASVSSRAHD